MYIHLGVEIGFLIYRAILRKICIHHCLIRIDMLNSLFNVSAGCGRTVLVAVCSRNFGVLVGMYVTIYAEIGRCACCDIVSSKQRIRELFWFFCR